MLYNIYIFRKISDRGNPEDGLGFKFNIPQNHELLKTKNFCIKNQLQNLGQKLAWKMYTFLQKTCKLVQRTWKH